eukprot:m.61446 g.61446  ORF g.61446 m.61446 type:complete len:391 (+) comp11412_c0_seq3:171-1343(+)
MKQASLFWMLLFIANINGRDGMEMNSEKNPHLDEDGKIDVKTVPIWVYWQYKSFISPFVELNLRSWKRHNPTMEIRLINESNAKTWIPDLPDEFFRVMDIPARSDIIRAGVMVHHGGLYMDTDFLAMKSFGPVLQNLKDFDIVSYGKFNDPLKKDVPDGDCDGHFSSNWHAARKGNRFSTVWWHNIKTQLTRHCPKGGMGFGSRMVCCHEEGEDYTNRKPPICQVPFGALERIKFPHNFVKKKTEAMTGPVKMLTDDDINMFCLNGDRTLIPHVNGEIYWMPWSPYEGQTPDGPWAIPNYKIRCNLTDGDLDCSAVQTRRALLKAKRYRNFFERIAYHLFFSTFHKSALRHAKTTKDVLHRNWLISEMYRRSLGLKVKGGAQGRHRSEDN